MVAGRAIHQLLGTAVLAIMWWIQMRLGYYPQCCACWSVPRRFVFRHSRLFSMVNNPSLEWKGSSHSTSDFVTHVLVAGPNAPTVEDAIASVLPEGRDNYNGDMKEIPLDNSRLLPRHYLQLGAVWFLPADAPRDSSHGQKPIRLSLTDLESTLEEGDYLRVHHTPRRFPLVYNYNWTRSISHAGGVIVARDDDKGFWVLHKPSHVPVHPTVDNQLENVAEMIRQVRLQEGEEDVYVSTPQRLDQNTSGLFVVATKKSFAAYFANLLRRKTDRQLSNSNFSEAIHKRYKCLVCLLMAPDSNAWSVAAAMDHLQSHVREQRLMRHYLEPSIRAPKHFSTRPANDTWSECLLLLVNVGEVCPLAGTQAGKELALALWKHEESIPTGCVAVVEVELELLTGRTHQIRGQLSAEGFPLVGDAQYGGAILQEKEGLLKSTHYIHSDELALQCCQLDFLDPDIVVKGDGTEAMVPSDRWNKFRLDECWWTPLIDTYREQSLSSGEATTCSNDVEQAFQMKTMDASEVDRNTNTPVAADMIPPPQVALSPGVHKYVLVKATHSSKNDERWFVKSAAPFQCGGPYHANVAEELVKWLEAAGYDAIVMGGGRINYNLETKHAIVYGFSYGFGKGDHAKASFIIENWSNGTITSTYDNSDSLY